MTIRRNVVPWFWAGAGLALGLAGSALALAPAHWMQSLWQNAGVAALQLDETQGSLWSGSGALTLRAGSGEAVQLPGRVQWRLRPAWDGLELQWQADCCLQRPWRWSLQPHWGGARLRADDADSQWPASWLNGLGTPWNTLHPEGQLSLHTDGLSLDWTAQRLHVDGRVQVDALHMASRLSTLRPLGSYRVQLQGGATPSLQLNTLEGALQLSGQGEWVGGRLRFRGEASARPEQQEALANLLNILGQRDGARSRIQLG